QAFLNILDAADSYTPSARFTTYLYRVIANLCMDRTRKRSPRLAEEMPEQRSSEPQPDCRMTDRERTRAIDDALAELTDRQRMATVLRYYEDLSYREIADVMDATEKAVERLLARARSALGKKLGEFGEK
ncbi:MAG: sigma-70 family RNA polymerase sigma factor, partial [Planctomycetota bacterium]